MIKKIIPFLGLSIVVIIIGIVYIKTLFLPVSSDSKNMNFMVNKGSSISLIANNLEKAGLIKNKYAFRFYVQISNIQNKIQPGEFELSPNLSLTQIIEKLKKGPTEILVTIPEGLRREEVAAKFATTLKKDESFVKDFISLTAAKEGYLFPDSYLFPKEATATQIVNRLTTTFDNKVKEVTYKQLIMASMLERETFADSEKPIVAGILYKRIENDWPLQVDATLQYAKDTAKFKVVNLNNEYWDPIYSEDKEINSSYNTYKNLGMPPSPIANPGLSSILAAISPETSEYWYYIHDNDGKIHFAKDLEEHNANIRKYLN